MFYTTLEQFGEIPDDEEGRVDWFVKVLNAATDAYDKGEPLMSDTLWDRFYFELIRLEQATGYTPPDSPTKTIHFAIVNELNKVSHNHPMLSLAKTKSTNELKDFVGHHAYIGMGKMDGLTVSLTYEKGKLVRAETRGDGEVGEDITHNARVIPSIPQEIPNMVGKLVVDGEIICTYDDFEYFKDSYKNPRNFAAGSIRLLDANECAKRRLTFIAWDAIQGLELTTTLSERLEILRDEFDFIIVPFRAASKWDETLIDEIKYECEEKGYPIDGIVFKYDVCLFYEKQGRTDHHFKGGLAYKFYEDEYETTLQSIEWQIGRTGVLTPVAYFTPINIGGTTVSRASLHNVGVMEMLSPLPWYAGYKLTVFKANEIIPQISAVTPAEPEGAFMFDVPKVCPSCGEPVSIQQNGAVKIAVCKNPKCTTSRIEKIIHYTSKKGMDIKGLSEATITKLWDKGWLKDIVDIYTLKDHRDEWIQMEGFGPKSVDNILAAIEKSKNTTFPTFISALGIPLIGKTVAKDLMNYFSSYEELMDAIVDGFNFSTIDRFGPAKDKALKEFDWSSADYIYENYLDSFTTFAQEYVSSNALDGVTVCITGKLQHFKNREQFKIAIINAGGKVTDSVTKKINYLINNDINSTSSKNKKAKEYNIEIISEGDFIKKFGLKDADS